MSVSTSFIPVANVLTDAALELRMEDFGAVGRPYFLAYAQRALQDLCYDAIWDERAWEGDVLPNLIVDLPEGIIGLKNVYVYTGDNCTISSLQDVRIKPNMIHKGGLGFFARNVNGSGDLFNFAWCAPSNWLYYAGYSNGKLYLSMSCAQYPRIRVEYYGLGLDGCKEFDIPNWAREAVTDYIIHKVALRMEQDNLQLYRGIIARKENQLSTGNPNGTWCRALARWNLMDSKERSDLITQTTRLGYSTEGYYAGYGYGTGGL